MQLSTTIVALCAVVRMTFGFGDPADFSELPGYEKVWPSNCDECRQFLVPSEDQIAAVKAFVKRAGSSDKEELAVCSFSLFSLAVFTFSKWNTPKRCRSCSS